MSTFTHSDPLEALTLATIHAQDKPHAIIAPPMRVGDKYQVRVFNGLDDRTVLQKARAFCGRLGKLIRVVRQNNVLTIWAMK